MYKYIMKKTLVLKRYKEFRVSLLLAYSELSDLFFKQLSGIGQCAGEISRKETEIVWIKEELGKLVRIKWLKKNKIQVMGKVNTINRIQERTGEVY